MVEIHLQFNEDNLDELVMKPEEYIKLFDTAKNRNMRDFAMFKTAFWGQLRRCEIIGLELDDIKWEKKKLDLRAEITKGRKPATINISQEALDILKDYIDNFRGTPKTGFEKLVFLYDGRKISNHKLWEISKEYRILTGLINYHFHMWRHTGCTAYATIEKDVKKLQKQLRHSDSETTMKYINYAEGVYKESYDKFEQAFSQKQKPEITTKVEETKPEQPVPPKKPIPHDPMVGNTDREMLMQMYKEGLLTADELRQFLTGNSNDNMYR